jgi:cytochrome c2
VRPAAAVAAATVLLAGAAPAAAQGPASPAAPHGATLFGRCAACHLADGAGVPGAFPPLRTQVGRYAATPAGRAYLVSVVSHGLNGAILVGADAIAGFMPAQNLDDAEAAAVLNHVVGRIAAPSVKTRPFTAAEVADLRKGREGASAQDSRALRPDALSIAP